jgi:mRNA-degrading endonuclease toxin of MazEF toxin-antitoxin module
MKQRKPQQGDIYLLSMNPTLGTEIQGKRPALVLSNAVSNQHVRVLMAPITQGANLDRVRGWATSLTGAGTKTQGAAPPGSLGLRVACRYPLLAEIGSLVTVL